MSELMGTWDKRGRGKVVKTRSHSESLTGIEGKGVVAGVSPFPCFYASPSQFSPTTPIVNVKEANEGQ